MLSIINAPNPVLSENAKQILKVDKQVINLIGDMKIALDAATDPIGVGLAAPQVGKSLRLFIAKPTLKSKVSVFINPLITKSSNLQKEKDDKTTKLEGCLSLPDIWGEVRRFNEINVEFLDEKEQKHNKTFKGFMAVIIQHEIDHLNGVLFPKRVLEQKGTLYKSEKDRKGKDIFEPINI